MKRLSDLEMAILGIVWKRAPCTPYTIAKEFFSSPSSHWRGSAGAVYPAVTRLQRLGLLRRRSAVRLGRPCGLVTLSARGLSMLRKWLLPPLPPAAAAITYDPLRTRAYFLAALEPRRQQQFLREAKRHLLSQFPVLQAECARYRRLGDWFSEYAQRGALYVMVSRIAWIEELQHALKTRPPKTAIPQDLPA